MNPIIDLVYVNNFLVCFYKDFDVYRYSKDEDYYKLVVNLDLNILPTSSPYALLQKFSDYLLVSENNLRRYLSRMGCSEEQVTSVFSYIIDFKYCFFDMKTRVASRLPYNYYVIIRKFF